MKYVFLKTRFEGFHRYLGAKEQVSYLRDIHRHMFYVKFQIEVFDNDREIEFIELKHQVEQFIKQIQNEEKAIEYSCETYAEKIIEKVKELYNRKMICEVSEDDENGAIIEYSGV